MGVLLYVEVFVHALDCIDGELHEKGGDTKHEEQGEGEEGEVERQEVGCAEEPHKRQEGCRVDDERGNEVVREDG